MHLAIFILTGTAPPTQRLAETVHDAIWAHLPEQHNVEHLTATATPDGIELVIFLYHDTDDPERYAQHLIDATAQRSPSLAALTSRPTWWHGRPGRPASTHP